METETVIETETATGAAEGAQPTGGDDHSQDAHQEGGEAAQPGRGREPAPDSGASDEARLEELLARGKKDPDTVYSDEELDFLEKHKFGELPPSKTAKAEDADADAQGQDADPDKGDKKPQSDKGKAPVDPDLAEAMRDVGAKTPKELRAKVKELRQQLTGKDAQANAQLRKDNGVLLDRVRRESAIWADVKSGKPEAVAQALAHVEKVYGLKLAVAGQAGAQPAGRQAAASEVDLDATDVLPMEMFADEESFKKANGFLRGVVDQVKALKGRVGDFDAERARNREQHAQETARVAAIDELVEVAGMKGMESIAKISDLRGALKRWYTGGEDNPALEPLQKVLDKANEYNVPVKVAWNILRGEGFEVEVATAESRGREAAYSQKPSRSLSGKQGKEQESYHNYSDDQLREMAEDYTKAPPNWFKDDDSPNPSTIPRRAWKYFFSPEEIAAFK